MKRILLSLAMLATLAVANAADIFVQNLDGTVAARYNADDVQRIDITTPGIIRIVGKDGTSVEFNSNSVPRISFTATPTSITAPENAVKAGGLRAWADGRTVYVSGTAKGETVAVFSVNGVRIAAGQAADGVTAIDAATLPKGVYVVKAGKQAVKILVK